MTKKTEFFFILLLLVLLWDLSTTVQNCPRKCQCWGYEVHCSTKGLRRFPAALPEGTLQLYIENNSIDQLFSLKAMNLSNLHTLTLQYNRITYLVPQTFSRVSRLQYLNLSSNNLRSISKSGFAGLTQLSLLSLAKNKITTLAPTAFSDLHSLRELFLSFNRISNLPRGLFSCLENLKNLHLDHNSIQIIRDGIFEDLAIINLLDLSYNLIRQFKSGATRGLVGLSSLNLRSNKIVALDDPSFDTEDDCVENDKMYGNNLQQSHSSAFYNLRKLQTIDLSNNSLTTIRYSWFSKLKQLKTVFLSGNNWRCNCFLKSSLMRLIRLHGSKVTVAGSLYCNEPEELRGLMVDDLSLQDITIIYYSKKNSKQVVEAYGRTNTVIKMNKTMRRNLFVKNHLLQNNTDYIAKMDSVGHSIPELSIETSTKKKHQNTENIVGMSKEIFIIKRFSPTDVTDFNFIQFHKMSTALESTSGQNKLFYHHNASSIAPLLVAITMSAITLSTCCFFILMHRKRSENTNNSQNRCCFVNKDTIRTTPLESIRSYTSYPLVYDNPLAQRPLPTQPNQLSSRPKKRLQKSRCERDDEINVRWTCGGFFGLGEKGNSSLTNSSSPRCHFNSNEHMFPFPSNYPPCYPPAYRNNIVHNKLEKQPSHLIKRQKQTSNYLIPMSSHNKNVCYQQEQYLRQNSVSEFAIIPAEAPFNAQTNRTNSDYPENRSKQINRERILEKMLEVLQEIDALDEFCVTNNKDLKQSWQDITHKYLEKRIHFKNNIKSQATFSVGEKGYVADAKLFEKDFPHNNNLIEEMNQPITSYKNCRNLTSPDNKLVARKDDCFSCPLESLRNPNEDQESSSNINEENYFHENREIFTEKFKNQPLFNMYKGEKSLNQNLKNQTNYFNEERRNVPMASYIMKEVEFKSRNSTQKNAALQDRRDSSDSMFVSVGCSSNDSEEETHTFSLRKKSKESGREKSQRSSTPNDIHAQKLQKMKKQFRRSMPINSELTNHFIGFSSNDHMDFAKKGKQSYGSNIQLNYGKKCETIHGNFIDLFSHNENNSELSYYQSKRNEKYFGFNCVDNVVKNNHGSTCSKLKLGSDQCLLMSSAVEGDSYDDETSSDQLEKQSSLQTIRRSTSFQNRKVSVSSFGTASVSSVEFQNIPFQKRLELKHNV